jgi:ABC-type transport system involved in cytochrome c biogenesis permease subunit
MLKQALTTPEQLDAEDDRWYRETLERLHDYSIQESRSLERMLVTVSCAAIGLSIALVAYLARDSTFTLAPLLAVVWAAFALSICTVFYTHYTCARTFMEVATCLETERNHKASSAAAFQKYFPLMHKHDRPIIRATRLGMLFFLIGVVTLFVFAYSNVINRGNMQCPLKMIQSKSGR